MLFIKIYISSVPRVIYIVSHEHSYYDHCANKRNKLIRCLIEDCILKSIFNLINSEPLLEKSKKYSSIHDLGNLNSIFTGLCSIEVTNPKGIYMCTFYCVEGVIWSVCRFKRLPDPKESNSNGAISETGAGSWAEMLAAGTSAHWKGQPCLFLGREDCGFFPIPTPIPWNQSQFLGAYQALNEQFLHYSFRKD